ncbi:hypothetical protein SAMN05444422_1114 [Halobiforma haloterrestris]|uniref:Uncharacterized protein n=1 Tax=Natronobacterium haloterrestre TaxID=148448 RepID=A0A1I1KAA1_NATHA|nr:hypothetical protein [Halobiforma haloterrestris]SFC57844.1 hypothetical protein SAMN05444422_1114 [Halobiforma haloterrestris]
MKRENPLTGLSAEVAAVTLATSLYLNIRYNVISLTLEETIVLVVCSVLGFWWGYNRIEESGITHGTLIWHRIVKPGTRATKCTLHDLAQRIVAFDFLVKFGEETKDIQQAQKIVSDFETIAFDELAMDEELRPSPAVREQLADEISTETSLFKRDGYRRIANILFEEQSKDEEKIRLILVFCREHVKAGDSLETGETIHDIKSGITRALSTSSCDFEQQNETAEWLLTAYGNAYDAIHHDHSLYADPLTGTPEDDLNEYYSAFIESFLPFRDRHALSEELFSTIIEVVDRGELDQSAVAKDVHDLIEKEKQRVRSEFENRDAYLLMSWGGVLSKYQSPELRETLQDKYPNHIDFGRKGNESEVSDLPEAIKLTFHIIFTERHFSSADEFLEDVLKFIPDNKIESGFVTAYKLEITDPAYEPERSDVEAIVPDEAKKQLDLIEFLETGTGSRAITETAIDNLLGRKVEVNELLAAIPANVFVEATPKQEDAFNGAYKDIKQDLKINNLYDWARYEPEEVVDAVVENVEEDVASEEEWLEISEQLVVSAKQCERAATT